jgi:hypothetical protein
MRLYPQCHNLKISTDKNDEQNKKNIKIKTLKTTTITPKEVVKLI